MRKFYRMALESVASEIMLGKPLWFLPQVLVPYGHFLLAIPKQQRGLHDSVVTSLQVSVGLYFRPEGSLPGKPF